MTVNEELCKYLREDDFYDFMLLWRKQYERFGTCAGRIHLPLTDSNREAIECFMGTNYHKQSHAVISYQTLKKALAETRFALVDFNEVLKIYFPDEIIYHKTAKEQKVQRLREFFVKIIQQFPDSHATTWLQYVLDSQNSTYLRIQQDWKAHPTQCEKQVRWVMQAVNALPLWKKEKKNMAIFASEITNDPHAFDKKGFLYYLLFQAICYFLGYQNEHYNSIKQNDILYEAGLYYDSISNYCSLARLKAVRKDGQLHQGWLGFYDSYEAFNANMENLTRIHKVCADSCKVVLVVENPSIFQALLQHAMQYKIEYIGFICTNGQLNTAAYTLLDYLQESNIPMYYSGDMDPEGLLIADRLKQRYKELLHLWHYTIDDYEMAVSYKHAGKVRLTMSEQLQDEQLQEIATYVAEDGIGYQENIVQLYLDDLDTMDQQF